VFDPISARVAESVGYEIGMIGGSVIASATLAAADLLLLTLSEFAAQIHRISCASNLCLVADADHGYGNALNVMRTVQELEHAGVAALTIEDSSLPMSFGQAAGEERMVSIEEAVGKLRAAVAARTDPSLVIVGRTSALRSEGTEGAIERAKAYASCGVDAIFFVGLEQPDQLEAIYRVIRLPIVAFQYMERERLANHGVRILLQGHHALPGAVKALRETYQHLSAGGSAGDVKVNLASAKEMNDVIGAETYKAWQGEFLR
jgi:carboxyvinyl-carboxyphosphonate phosphorylmutase